MVSYKLILPEHMNHYGSLFGGNLLKWVDEVAWIAVSQEYPGGNFVTIGMDHVEFRKGCGLHSVLRFDVNRIREGNTSVSYRVIVVRRSLDCCEEEEIFHTEITFVRIGKDGKKLSLRAPVCSCCK